MCHSSSPTYDLNWKVFYNNICRFFIYSSDTVDFLQSIDDENVKLAATGLWKTGNDVIVRFSDGERPRFRILREFGIKTNEIKHLTVKFSKPSSRGCCWWKWRRQQSLLSTHKKQRFEFSIFSTFGGNFHISLGGMDVINWKSDQGFIKELNWELSFICNHLPCCSTQ